MDLQALVDRVGEIGRLARSDYHLCLGALIEKLSKAPSYYLVVFGDGSFPLSVHSYRGYYSDLAFDCSDREITVADFLKIATDALGKTFQGYKGGDFVMSESTPLWASEWGVSSGLAIVAAEIVGGKVILLTKQID